MTACALHASFALPGTSARATALQMHNELVTKHEIDPSL